MTLQRFVTDFHLTFFFFGHTFPPCPPLQDKLCPKDCVPRTVTQAGHVTHPVTCKLICARRSTMVQMKAETLSIPTHYCMPGLECCVQSYEPYTLEHSMPI